MIGCLADRRESGTALLSLCIFVDLSERNWFVIGVTRTVGLVIMLALVAAVAAMPVVAFQEPLPPMVIDGTLYVDGERAPDGTTVEARVDGDTMASTDTTTSNGRSGRFILVIEDITEDAEDSIVFFVDGEAAQVLIEGEAQDSVPLESGFHRYEVIIGASPETYVLTMGTNGSGQTVPAVGEHIYPADAVVRIGAVPDGGWQFDGWIGDVAEQDAVSTMVVMDADKTVTAEFSRLPIVTPTATPEPTGEAATAVPSPTPTETAEPGTPEETPAATEAATSPTPGPSPTATPSEAAASPTPGPSATSASASPAGSPTPGPSPTPGEVTGAGTGEAGTAEAETAEVSPTSGAPGDETSSPPELTPTATEMQEGSGEGPGLLVAAVALAVLGVVAVGFGIYGLTRKG
jgi:hypothetical protein